MAKGKLIVIEGSTDGVGKSTQYELLKKYLEENNYQVITHHFPSYNSFQGEGVVKYLNGDFGATSELSPYFINTLYAMDRAITWQTELKEAYENGAIILLDRYTTSSLFYQSALLDEKEKNEFIEYVDDYEYNKLALPRPDLVIFLEASFNKIKEMRKNRVNYEGNSNDIHETNEEFLKKVSDNSIFVADKYHWDKIMCMQSDELLCIEDIHNKVLQRVKKII